MYCWTLENVTVQHVGGFGLDVQGSVFEGIVSNSWMIGNAEGGRTAGVFQLGSASADSVIGSTAGDVLQGAGGADTLTGGAGADRFVYKAADSIAAAPDTITDFQHGIDQIDLGGVAGLGAADGTVQFQGQLAGTGDLTLNPHNVALLETGGNTLVLGNTSDVAELVKATDTDAADVKIVLLGTSLGLTGSDFDLF
jgi:Ca2+-binding RTX toxin-like protein